MVDPKNGWLVMGIQSMIVVALAALVALGCASPQTADNTADNVGSDLLQTVGDVSVDREGDGSVVLLGGLTDPVYSVSMADEGRKVVIDLVGVSAPATNDWSADGEETATQVAAYDGVVDLVSLSTFDDEGGMPLTRVEVTLATAGTADVETTDGGLEVRIAPGGELAASDAALSELADAASDATDESTGYATAQSDWSAEPVLEISEGTQIRGEAVAQSLPSAPMPATELTGLTANSTAEGVLIGLSANGEIGNVEAFTLDNPARLVLDLPGLATASVPAKTHVGTVQVKSVRTAAHAGKVRVVIDGGSGVDAFEGRQVMPAATGLFIAIGGGDDLLSALDEALAGAESQWLASAASSSLEAQPLPMAKTYPAEGEISAAEPIADAFEGTENVAEATFAAEPEALPMAKTFPMTETEPAAPVTSFEVTSALATVRGLHYERSSGFDRTAILTDESVDYTTSAPDATTLVVRISNAQISEAASDRIFPQAGGPVSLIHAFQQPEVATPEVRVVFTRAPNQNPVITREGGSLFVAFEDLGVAAAAPPAFPNAGQTSQVAAAPATTPIDTGVPAGITLTEPGASNTPAAPAVLPDSMGVVAALPSFDGEGGMADPALAVPSMPASAGPAAVEVPAAIEVLEEGGLIDGKEYRGRRVSLDFKDVEIADVLRLIAEVSDLNIIAGDEVSGKVTIRLVETPWDQALDVILMTKGLGFVRVGNVLRIAPSDILKAEEEVRLQERRNKEKLEDLEVKLLPVNYATVKDTEGLVKRLLSSRGTVNLDERTNTLIIKDISSVIDEATALITAIDTQTPQVMIEAKIVEANLDFSRELGSVWGIQTQQFNDPLTQASQRTLPTEDITFLDDNGLTFANPITQVPTGLATLGALILDQDFRVDAQIQAAESTGDGKVVSSPRIVTLDNKEARIEQGVSIPFQTFEGGDAKLEFIDAVLSLVVTPHITADQSVIMQIEVTRNAPDDSVSTPTGSPAIAKNVAETETLVKDGQTLVLGGIYTITKSQRQSRIPYLHRIPVIGNAFKNNEVTDARKELLVFVTPRIVRLPEMAAK